MDQDIRNIVDHLTGLTSVDFSGYNDAILIKLLDKRVKDSNTSNYHEYLQYLQDSLGEPEELISALTVQVSEFYRNPYIYNYLSEIILPPLIMQKKAKGETTFRGWSAGCAQGEEAYTLAMVVRESIEKNHSEIVPRIFATDIEKVTLRKAQEGIYSSESIRKVPYGLVKKHLQKNGNLYHVKKSIQKDVSFSVYDLVEQKTSVPPESVFGNFDIVFCKNVMIYYTPAIQLKIMTKLHKSLAPGGLLILGESEFLPHQFDCRFKALLGCQIYQKRE